MAATTIRRRRRPFKRPGSVGTALIVWAAFVVVFVSLALQLRAGRDPVLGAAKPAKRPVVLRRVVVTKKVVHDAPATAAPDAAAAAAPVTAAAALAPAPAPAAPAPAPVAPAPAPVTTQSS